jgi:hypothetical protein
MTKAISQCNTVTIKSALKKANVKFDKNATRDELIRIYQAHRDAHTHVVEHHTPAAQRLSFDSTIDSPADSSLEDRITELDNLLRKGLISDDMRTRRVEQLLDEHFALAPTPPHQATTPIQPQVISETGERKREFSALRERYVGEYHTPYPCADLRTFIIAFPSTPTFYNDEEHRLYYTTAVSHYRHYYTLIHQLTSPPARYPPEPFIEDFRTFLGFMAALYWLNECTTIGNKRVGGVAYSFSCRPGLLAEDLQNIQRSAGNDIISKLVHLTLSKDTAPPAKRPREPPCSYCLVAKPNSVIHHTDAQCRSRPQPSTVLTPSRLPRPSYTPQANTQTGPPPPYTRPPPTL